MSQPTRRPSPRAGHGLFTTRHASPGDLILTIASPSVTIPDDANLSTTCSNCMRWNPPSMAQSILGAYQNSKQLSACLGCKTVKYCGKACQKQDWAKAHKHECKIFSNLHPRILPASVRTVIRVLLQRLDTSMLQSHVGEFQRRQGKWEMIKVMAKGAYEYSFERGIGMGEAGVMELYCKVLVNSATLVTETFGMLGIAFDTTAAMINHDCEPNAVMVFDGRRLNVRALREIAEDEEVTISYIDHTMPRERRREELREKYFFTCQCQRCVGLGGSLLDGFICACGGVASEVGGKLVCRECAKVQSIEMSELQALGGYALAAVDSASAEELLKAIKALYSCPVWPLQRQPLPALHHSIIHTEYIPTSSWNLALLHSLLLYLRVDPVYYPQRHHPVRVVHGFTLANLFLQITDADYGKIIWGLLCETAAQVGRSHGDESGFAEIVRRKRAEVGRDLRAEEPTREWVGMKLDDIGLDEELRKVMVLVDGLIKELNR